MTNTDAGTEPEKTATAVRPGPERPWLGTPSGIIALTALVLSVFLIPLFFPLAGLSLVLAVIALVRRRPRPRSAWVLAIISGVLLAAVLAVGILASVFLFTTESGSGSPQPPSTSAPPTPGADEMELLPAGSLFPGRVWGIV